MTEERKERRFCLGYVDLRLGLDDPSWVELTDLRDALDAWIQRAQDQIEALVMKARFTPTHVRLRYYEPEPYAEYAGAPYEAPSLAVYGYRPETDKELAARIAKQRKKADKKLTAAAAQERQERQLLAKLQLKYPDKEVP